MYAPILALALVAAPPQPPANLVLVTIDTLRADHLGCYGYAAAETPTADRLAREGILVEDATVQAPQTRPSHVTIFTGRLPYEHGIRDNYSPPLNVKWPTLATALKGGGYATAGFIGAYVLAANSGLNRGFDVYDEFSETGGTSKTYLRAERQAEEVVDAALAWLRKRPPGPFFVWLHLYDPHTPYAPPAPYLARHGDRPYDGEVAYADAQLGRLVAYLDREGLRGRTLLAVTSDHGEGLGDHGEDEHLMFVYDSTLHVPLLMSWPGVLPAGARVSGQFRSVDLLPTVLDLLGAAPVPASGLSRAAELRGGRRLPDNESYAETLFGQLHFGYAPVRALRAEGWKYIAVPRAELYNLKEDPGELRNLIDTRGNVAAHLAARLGTHDSAGRAAPKLALPDAGTMERLATLGYLSVGAPRPADAGVDPKDRIAEYQAHTRNVQRAVRLYVEGKLDEALPLLEKLWRSKVASLEVGYYYGMALFRRGRWAEATKPLEEALSLVPRWTMLYVNLSNAYWELGRKDEAQAIIERGLRLEPRSPMLLRSRGVLLHRRGDLAGARTALEQAVTANPRDSTTRTALSAVLRDQGASEQSIAQLRESVRLDPRSGDGWNALGVMLQRAGRPGEAAQAFRKAIDVRADDADALFNLGGLLLAEGRADDAQRLLTRLVASTPGFPGGRAALEEATRRAAPLPADQVELRVLRVPDRAQAETALRRLAGGADFAEVARAESVDPSASLGGYLGVFRPQDLAEPLRSAASSLRAGDLSPVLETTTGFVVLRRDR